MLCGKYFLLFVLSLFLFKSKIVYGFTEYFLNEFHFLGGCPRTFDIKNLERDVENNFFGQHIASKIIISALKGNLHRSRYNKKPLVMCFQGPTGTGKNFLSDIIANHMFNWEKVKKLRYHVIHGGSQFPLQSKKNDYKEKFRSYVKSAIKTCDTNLFVIDEAHFIPMDILDILIPILENNDVSIDSRNSIFIFLTNTGSDFITQKYFDFWIDGLSREDITIEDFDTVLLKSAFSEGGLKKSSIIDSHIIDFYVPFLPLEKAHAVQCIERELKNLNKPVDSKTIREILRIIPFRPEPQKLFAVSGCRRINAWVSTK